MIKVRDLSLSISLHCIVLLCLIVGLVHFSKTPEHLALKAIKPIWVTVVKTTPPVKPKPVIKLDKHALIPIKKTPKVVIHKQVHHTVHQLARKALTGKQMNALQKELYNQIHQHYHIPQQASLMQEEGTTEVSFLVTPNGSASSIHIKHASPFPLLDKAAIAAVHSAAPFKIARFHLTKAHSFQIAINFLNNN
jgi:TonB family protein